MTSSLQRNVHNPRVISEALGRSLKQWEEHSEKVQREGGTILDALSSFYISQLSGTLQATTSIGEVLREGR